MKADLDWSKFVCRKCGHCCRLPGYVRVTQSDIESISKLLNLSPSEFEERYTRIADKPRLSLTENPDGSCVFLENNRCIIYSARPLACRTYPMVWQREETFTTCEGAMSLVRMKENSYVQ